MKTFVCQICKHIAFEEAPVDCPVCGMAIENFENEAEAIKKPVDDANLSEMEKKHIPQVSIIEDCALGHAEGCLNVQIQVGEIEHVMESEHFISFIDIYINKKYLSRVMLNSRRMHPTAGLHLNEASGKLTVVAHCNIHGSWVTKRNLVRSEVND